MQIGNSSHVLEEATVLVELQAAGLTVKKAKLKFEEPVLFLFCSSFFLFHQGPR